MKFTLGLSCCLLLTLMSRQAEAQTPDNLCRNDHRYVDDHIYPNDWHLIVDSYDYENLFEGSRPAWDRNDVDGDGSQWNDAFGGTCQLEIGIGSCSGSSGTNQNNWFFTDYNSYGRAIQVFIDATFRWSSCTNNCRVNVNRYDTDGRVSETQQEDTSNYDLIVPGNAGASGLQQASSGDTSVTLEFTRPNGFDGLYLGFQDRGVCGGQIKRFQAYYKICVPSSLTTGRPLVRFEEIALPLKNSALPKTQSATCTENAMPVASMTVSAYGNGTCVTNARCACRGGYKVNNTVECVACPAGTYREFRSSTEGCTSCPANSEAQMEGSPQCNCTPGYCRAPGEPVSKECTSSPSEPTSLMVTSVTSNSISISWSPPTSTGGRNDVTYNVEYEEVGSLDGFVRSNTVPITGTSFTIRGLKPVTTYIVRVIAENGVSSFKPDQVDIESRATELVVTTGEGLPGCPSQFEVVDNIIALWQPPEVPNGNISGYQISLTYTDENSTESDSEQMRSFSFGSSSFFYILRKGVVPENVTATLQIRARTSAGFGEWCGDLDFVPFGAVSCPELPTTTESTESEVTEPTDETEGSGSCALGDIVTQLAITAAISVVLTALILIVLFIIIVACCKCCLNSGDDYRSGGGKKRKTDFDLDNPSFSKNGY